MFREKQYFVVLATIFGLLNKGGLGAPEHRLKSEWSHGWQTSCHINRKCSSLYCSIQTGNEPRELLGLPTHQLQMGRVRLREEWALTWAEPAGNNRPGRDPRRSAGHCCKVHYLQPGETALSRLPLCQDFGAYCPHKKHHGKGWASLQDCPGLLSMREKEYKGSRAPKHSTRWAQDLQTIPSFRDSNANTASPSSPFSSTHAHALHVQVLNPGTLLHTSGPCLRFLDPSLGYVLLRPTGPGQGLNLGSAPNYCDLGLVPLSLSVCFLISVMRTIIVSMS